MNIFRKKHIYGVLFAVLLTSFTVYVVLDTFVITRVYTVIQPKNSLQSSSLISDEANESVTQSNAANQSAESPEDTSKTTSTAITADSYSDSNISITITEYKEYGTTIYVADVKVSSVDYLKTAFAQNVYGRNITAKTSETAQNNNAILAINGDYYGAQNKGYVLRNGTLYRDTVDSNQEDLAIMKDGSFKIISENQVSASELQAEGALQVLSFGPALVTNGSVSVTEGEEVGKAMASNPRTAVGVIDNLHYLFVVSDGRTTESTGLSLYQLAEFMQSKGVKTAYNLDGGGSSTMYFNGKVINNPTTNGNKIEERSVSDIVYIG